jgi:hypothetical protein
MYASRHAIMTKLTQGQAAKVAGVSRTTVWRAMKDGRLSYEKAEDGSFKIDGSELLRVFPQANLEGGTQEHVRTGHSAGFEGSSPSEYNALHALVRELKEDKTRLLQELERTVQERAQLLAVIDRQSEHVRLLTDQRPKDELPSASRPSLLRRVFGWG